MSNPDAGLATPESILKFWFGTPPLKPRHDLWWGGRENDAVIASRFEPTVAKAVEGGFSQWTEQPRSALALILLLDQMTRNVYRGTARAFAGDARALDMTRSGLERGDLDRLHPLEAVFYLMPLEHHESLESLDRTLLEMQRLADRAEPELTETLIDNLRFARDHRDIIERFGRYPHRNEVLGRTSTTEELAWLAEGGRRFGQ